MKYNRKNLIQRIEIAEKERRSALRKGKINQWRALTRYINRLRAYLKSS